jgi:2-polyprenylphenol 6-hydroxylase
MANAHQVLVVGAGPVGLACALALAQLRNVDVTVVERQTLGLAGVSSQFDHRVYAVSPSSKTLLEGIGAWSRTDASRIEPIRAMQVFGDDISSSGSSELALHHGTPLAFMVEHAALMHALQTELAARQNIRLLDGLAVTSLAPEGVRRKVSLTNGQTLAADMLIAADGSNSPLRAMLQIATTQQDYESDGVVANFRVERAHLGVARQWFSADGVLAYLPLPESHMSIVFSVARTYADTLMQMPESEFADCIGKAGRASLGCLTLASGRARFPLKRVMAQQWVAPAFALIGDAAHAIHPMAGQGANLGFADVACLAETLATRSILSGIGDVAVLRRYERARREDAVAMSSVTGGLRALYLDPHTWARQVRNRGLNVLDKLPIAKLLLVGHAIGH